MEPSGMGWGPGRSGPPRPYTKGRGPQKLPKMAKNVIKKNRTRFSVNKGSHSGCDINFDGRRWFSRTPQGPFFSQVMMISPNPSQSSITEMRMWGPRHDTEVNPAPIISFGQKQVIEHSQQLFKGVGLKFSVLGLP